MSQNGSGSYTDAHRAFLQAFISNSTMTLEEAQPILAKILSVHENREVLPADINEPLLQSLITTLNSSISPFDLEIRPHHHQSTRQKIWVLVNTASNPIVQLATTLTPDEIAFVKRVLDAMFVTNNSYRGGREIMAVTSIEALGLAKGDSSSSSSSRRRESGAGTQSQAVGTVQGLTMVQAEKVLGVLVDEGWFEKSRKGYFSLSPRGLMELRGWLLDMYNDDEDEDSEGSEEEGGGGEGANRAGRAQVLRIKFCYACREMITTNLFRVQKNRRCPMCKNDWTGQDFVGERAATAGRDKSQTSRRKSGAAQQSSSGWRSSTRPVEEDIGVGVEMEAVVVGEDDEEAEEEEEEEEDG
ncbi:hypothetical protein MMC25_002431 [Agyrium rufum]|nr:hypothetical protein [Agyrium rufum]